jgi:hypothetical protein
MRFISIGGRCNVTYQIRKYSKNQETLFFDWLDIDMDSVIQLLQCKNITDILYYDNIINESQNLKPRIILKTLPKCVFINDLSNNYNDHDVYTFLEKYKKRLNKIIELINGTEKLCFIRYGKIDELTKETFMKTILTINPKCSFILVSVIDDTIHKINKGDRFIEINLTRNLNRPQDDWTTSYLHP